MPVTLRDIAARAKTSVATVSKSLRGITTIPPSTRERIRKIADQMGYRPHPLVAALMRHRRKRRPSVAAPPVLAYVTAYPTEHGWQSIAFLRALYGGARQRADRRGYALTPFWLKREGITGERFCEILRVRGIRGMLLNPFPKYGAELDLPWHDFSVVAHGLSLGRPLFNRTSNDHFQSMLLAMRECERRGYRRPGFALEHAMTVRLEYRWEAAYAISGVKLGLSTPRPLLTSGAPAAEEIVRWVRRERIDVVIGVFLEEDLPALAQHGIGAGLRVGLVSLAVPRAGSKLAGIRQNPDLMGSVAADLLIDMIERNETGIPPNPLTLTLPGIWHEGQTLRAAAKRPSN